MSTSVASHIHVSDSFDVLGMTSDAMGDVTMSAKCLESFYGDVPRPLCANV